MLKTMAMALLRFYQFDYALGRYISLEWGQYSEGHYSLESQVQIDLTYQRYIFGHANVVSEGFFSETFYALKDQVQTGDLHEC
ncbi:hypothetical protein D9M72_272710 [compost metagenome]